MFKQLQKSFVKSAMLSFTAVLLAVLVAVNIVNYRQTVDQVDRLTTMLVNNDGTFPDAPDDKGPKEHPEHGMPKGMEFRKDDQMATRYAVVRVANDTVQSVDRTHLVSLDEEALKELGLRIAQGTATKGWEGSLRYQVAKTDAGTMVVLVDANRETQQVSRLMMVTGAVFVLCLAVVYVLVRLASKRAIRPFVENVERQQQFIANASHEIKTPLAVLSANTDLLAMMGTEAKFVDSNKRQIKRLNSLVEQMLILSRYDEGEAAATKEEVDLVAVTKTIVEEILPVLNEKGLQVEFTGEAQTIVTTNKSAMTELIRILLDNAMKYTVGEPVITVEAKRNQLAIGNETEPMTKEQVSQIFDRFYRVDSSRNRTTGGSGLGLSIAQKIAETNDVQLTAELTSETQIRFVIATK
ncbi:sensor histidine kinase [Streptococcus sp. 263_SSPC]|uniref:sensor histidine kinase n=1 Tax=Streptococcus sp. 263_SSPC TaxID=1579343 RepID=UPI000661291A|nr:HAMP domain-containing sensor histidine kinase [Streptococcus sp. 263_SSPC]